MDKTKKQQMRFTDSELSIIKNTFADNELLLKAIRKHFLQMELSKKESAALASLSKEALVVVRKAFLPTLDGDAPIHQVIDLWMTLEVKGKDVEAVYHDAIAREKLIKYLDEQLLLLEGTLSVDAISFKDLTNSSKDMLSVYVNLTVRNTVLAHVEMQLNQFQVLAGAKDETVEETKERLFKDSAK